MEEYRPDPLLIALKADEYEKVADDYYSGGREWRRRVIIWLAIANAAALAGVGSRLVEGPQAYWLLGSAWLFFAGLIASGAVGWLSHRQEMDLGIFYRVRVAIMRDPQSALNPSGTPSRYVRPMGLLLWASGLSLTLGLALPLAGLTLLAFGVRLGSGQ